jgi:hypothetical protein
LQTKNFAINKENILAVYKHYEKIYCEKDKDYLWAGLAKLAGAPVYGGLSDAQYGRLGSYLMPPIMSTISISLLKQTQDILIQGNINIYKDLAWQFSAYRNSGIDGLKFVRNQSPTALDYIAWQKINDAISANNSSNLSEGNVDILRREQQVILVETYEDLDSLLPLNALSWIFSYLAKNPVPNGPPFWEVVPLGKLSNFDDRWKWITDSGQGMWKLWTDASISTRRTWVQTPLRTRVDDGDYNLTPFPIW